MARPKVSLVTLDSISRRPIGWAMEIAAGRFLGASRTSRVTIGLHAGGGYDPPISTSGRSIMPGSRRVRIVFSAGVVAAVVAVTSGIALAVGSASQSASVSAIACVNAHQTLRLVNANGGCPSGFTRFRLAAAPTALTVNWTGGSGVSRTVRVGGLTFAATCDGKGINGAEALILMSSAHSYVLQGTYFFNDADGA